MSTTFDFLSRSSDFRDISAGTVIFSQGDPGDMMYVIKQGEVEISHNGQVFEVAGAGNIIGEMALIDHSPRSATATAKTDCQIVPVDNKRFVYMVQETPNFALKVMKVMSERLRTMNDLRR